MYIEELVQQLTGAVVDLTNEITSLKLALQDDAVNGAGSLIREQAKDVDEEKPKPAPKKKAAPKKDKPKAPELADVRAALLALAKHSGPEVAKRLFSECGCSSVADLKKTDYQPIIDAANALMNDSE